MAKSSKTTESDRRHAFSSFKERVDSIKIEPSRKLQTRAFDSVETSYLLATLEHWKEVNISKDFTECWEVIESLCQTLPQILYHQEKIFDTLSTHVQRADVNSIQPSLELMTQFVHDLGPDFMPYYVRFLHLIVGVAESTNPNELQNLRNPSNVLEWCFNCLAFAFKYLARILVADVKPTFIELIPTLLLVKKTYISRFCAEALSFLVRKLDEGAIRDVIDLTFRSNANSLEENECLRASLVTLYSESMKNTKSTFHSKAPVILSSLVMNALESQTSSDEFISVVCDILLQVLHHGSSESCARFYSLTFKYLSEIVDNASDMKSCTYSTQILTVLCFLDSGKKMTSWSEVFAVIQKLTKKIESIGFHDTEVEYSTMSIFVHLMVIVIRNCNLQDLTQHFKELNSSVLSLAKGKYYLSFIECSLFVSKEKMDAFGTAQLVQSFTNGGKTSEDFIKLALFLMKSSGRFPELALTIPFKSDIINSLKVDSGDDEWDLLSVYWKSVLLLHSTVFTESETQILLDMLSSLVVRPRCKLLYDSIGAIISVLSDSTKVQLSNQQAIDVFSLSLGILNESRISKTFLHSFEQLLIQYHGCLREEIVNRADVLSRVLSPNFSLPDSEIREVTAKLLSTFYSTSGQNVPDALSQMMLIDQIPLTVTRANDVKMRIRQFFSSLGEDAFLPSEVKEHISHFVIGLLSNQFQPCWLAVYEGLPHLLKSSCSKELWEVLVRFLNFNYDSDDILFSSQEPQPVYHGDEGAFKCQPSDDRMNASFANVSKLILVDEADTAASIFEYVQRAEPVLSYKNVLLSRVLAAINAIPSLAERNGSEFLRITLDVSRDALDVSDEENLDESMKELSSWTSKNKLALISTFSKFKNLKKLPGNEQLYELLLHQLTSRQAAIQKEALNVLLAWNKPSLNKYKDDLRNLLDDKLFREVLQSIISSGSDSKIEDSDVDDVVPIVLRILFGRAKVTSKSNSKSGRKSAVVSILPNFPTSFIQQFLDIMTDGIDYQLYFNDPDGFDFGKSAGLLKIMTGYLNMLYEIYNTLGFKYATVLRSTLWPLVYSLVTAQTMIDLNETEGIDLKIARNVRQLGFRCLNTLFKVLEGGYEWGSEANLIFDHIVQPRLPKFSEENAQQPSSLMLIMLGWIEWPSTIPFLFHNDFAATKAIMKILSNPHAKDSVIDQVLGFCISALTKRELEMDNYFTVLAIIVDALLDSLPSIIETSEDRDINSKAASILLLMIEGGYINEDDTRKKLVAACTSALKKSPLQVGLNDKVSILLSLSSIIDECQYSVLELEPLVDVCSKGFRTYKDRSMRESLVKVFVSLGKQISDFAVVAQLLSSLNSYSGTRMAEPNFEKRLQAFRKINEELYPELSIYQWLPLLHCALFFINDIEEFALRSNGALMLMKFVDCFSAKESEEASEFISVFRSVCMPYIRQGLKKEEEQVREEYINVLAHTVRHSKLPEFEGLKILTNDDRDLDFFSNLTHIQIVTRQKAIRGLIDVRGELNADSIYHYLLPITEVYVICKDERYRNILDDTHEAWSYLVRCISWDNFKKLIKKHLLNLSKAPESELRDRVNLLSRISQALDASSKSKRDALPEDNMPGLPEHEEIDRFIMGECIPVIMKILRVRNDDTIVARTPLAEVAVNLLLCTSEKVTESELAGTLTSTCQVLRSHTQHLRDAVRKTLSKIAKNLGARYFKFIIKELKTALSRGAQIHVLSYTVHYLMVATNESFKVGDLDDSVEMIAGIIMEDTFGASGQEKDAEGYVSKMREVKSKKSYDSGEILSSKISLPYFRYLIEPVKLLLAENIPLKTQRKLDELLRRYALGLNHNPHSSSRDMVVLCYELHKQSLVELRRKPKFSTNSAAEDHFLVKLDAKRTRVSTDRSQYLNTLQKMSFELLRTALGRHAELLTVSNIDGFLPLIELSLGSDDEGLLQAVFKVLDLVIKLPFDSEKDAFFEKTALRAFTILQNSPTMASDVCQMCLRYLTTVVRHKPSIQLNDTAYTLLLTRIIPDLEEPDKQAPAFNFLKAIVSQHVMLPEVYDVMDKVANIMVVNHTKEIRDMSRSVYFQFLMEYEQGSKKLNSAFKFLVNNLEYPTQFGRQSVMELIHSIVLRSSSALLMQFATSFFVGLSNVAVADESSKCREMATSLISQIMKKLGATQVQSIENFILAWVKQESNHLLQRCGLLVYKIYVSVFGYDHNPDLDKNVLALVTMRLKNSKASDLDDDVDWEDVYTSLGVASVISSSLKENVFSFDFEDLWKAIMNTLLYPHTWVRLHSARLVGVLLLNLDSTSFQVTPYEVQTIAYKTLRQLSAPSVSTELSSQAVKNLVAIIKKWELEKTEFIVLESTDDEVDDSSNSHYSTATEFAVSRICGIMRQESHRGQDGAAKASTIQLTAMIIQILSDERLMEFSERIVGGLYNFIDPDHNEAFSDDVVSLAKECLKILEDRIGITKYTSVYSAVKRNIENRRLERRAKRAQLAVNAPEVAARRKIRKHERFREKRKHERDENGFYKPKRKRFSRT